MTERQIITRSLLLEFNIGWIVVFIIFVWMCVKFPGVRKFVKDALENGDDKAQHEDANKALIFATIISLIWVLCNTLLMTMHFGPDAGWYTVLGFETTTLLILLGIKKITS